MRIYVASSWRNDYQPEVVRGLREVGHDVYDFRNPTDGDHGFHWSEIDGDWKQWTVEQYINNLRNPIARDGFAKDYDAMCASDGCVLLCPCGRSAHLEAGWFIGRGKPTWILAAREEPELMYKLATGIHGGMGSMLLAIQEYEDDLAIL